MSNWILGLTGGIGSGKTAASDYLQSKGIAVVDADVEARIAVEPNRPAWQAIREHFGKQALNTDLTLNRAWLRQTVFANPDERVWLEQLTHPIIRDQICHKLEQHNSDYALLASPLLFESKQDELVDRVLLIDVSTQTQLERASLRDESNPEQIQKIIDAQMPRPLKQQKSDDIILNESSLESLYKQLDEQHLMYLKLAKQKQAHTS